ncbi:MAG: hypothetical protein AAF413_03990 [Patescibacteria group bacterium]
MYRITERNKLHLVNMYRELATIDREAADQTRLKGLPLVLDIQGGLGTLQVTADFNSRPDACIASSSMIIDSMRLIRVSRQPFRQLFDSPEDGLTGKFLDMLGSRYSAYPGLPESIAASMVLNLLAQELVFGEGDKRVLYAKSAANLLYTAGVRVAVGNNVDPIEQLDTRIANMGKQLPT